MLCQYCLVLNFRGNFCWTGILRCLCTDDMSLAVLLETSAHCGNVTLMAVLNGCTSINDLGT